MHGAIIQQVKKILQKLTAMVRICTIGIFSLVSLHQFTLQLYKVLYVNIGGETLTIFIQRIFCITHFPADFLDQHLWPAHCLLLTLLPWNLLAHNLHLDYRHLHLNLFAHFVRHDGTGWRGSGTGIERAISSGDGFALDNGSRNREEDAGGKNPGYCPTN